MCVDCWCVGFVNTHLVHHAYYMPVFWFPVFMLTICITIYLSYELLCTYMDKLLLFWISMKLVRLHVHITEYFCIILIGVMFLEHSAMFPVTRMYLFMEFQQIMYDSDYKKSLSGSILKIFVTVIPLGKTWKLSCSTKYKFHTCVMYIM